MLVSQDSAACGATSLFAFCRDCDRVFGAMPNYLAIWQRDATLSVMPTCRSETFSEMAPEARCLADFVVLLEANRLAGYYFCHAVSGGLRSGVALVVVRLEVVPLPPRCSVPTVAGCRLGVYPAGRDRWGGKRAAKRMSEDQDTLFSTLVLWAFSTGVFQHQCINPH